MSGGGSGGVRTALVQQCCDSEFLPMFFEEPTIKLSVF